jgi:recombination protein RecT
MNAITKSDVDVFKGQVESRASDFKMALPAHIPLERFQRVVMTAVTSNPDLMRADRRSLFESAMKAAQDGLIPDSREGALVIFGGKVQWMPMIGGILKRIRNSGELLSISSYVAYENDEFTYVLGDDEKIEHRPALENRGKPRLAYAIAKTKDGGIYREVMTVAEVEKVRSVSRAGKSGPWVQWWDEMARKTVLRRLAKRLPTSGDLDDLIRRDDALYDFDAARGEPPADAPKSLAGRLDAFASGGAEPAHDAQTGEIISNEDSSARDEAVQDGTGAEGGDSASQAAGPEDAEKVNAGNHGPAADNQWFVAGAEAARKGMSRTKGLPGELRSDERAADADAWRAGFDSQSDGSAQ